MAIPRREFGRTGHLSSRVIFGGALLAGVTDNEADRALDLLVRHGINHIDVAPSYGDGAAEKRLKPWLRREPRRFFLATKTHGITRLDAREDLERSLDRLGVDHVDLWQLHNLVDPIDWDLTLSPGGAIEAAIEAREEGLIRWIGVTGHGVQIAAMHRRSLERFNFDSVLLPYNYQVMQLDYYASNFEALVAAAVTRRVAVQTITSIALAPWWGKPRTHSTWYRPLDTQADIDLATWWVLGRPEVFLNSPSDLGLLEMVVDAAERFEWRPDDVDMDTLVKKRGLEPIFV